MAQTAAIYGLAGLELTDAEISFFKDAQPWGFILFARNIGDGDQVRALTDTLRALTGRAETPILIDQEGGRVARLRPPAFRPASAAAVFGKLWEETPGKAEKLCWLNSFLMGQELARLGVTVDCLPVLDLPQPGADPIIGDRAYGMTPGQVIPLGRRAAEGLLAAGVLPVIKHIPGHGRAEADSHHALPVVTTPAEALAAHDFSPFRAMSDLPLAMTAHVVYTAFDPAHPATVSPTLVNEVIRSKGPAGIGFDGLLMTDDLSMKALQGSLGERAEASFAAGCDVVLHCNGQIDEMAEIAGVVPRLEGQAFDRAARATAWLTPLPGAVGPQDAETLAAMETYLAQALSPAQTVAQIGPDPTQAPAPSIARLGPGARA